jgi:hypothetical protein
MERFALILRTNAARVLPLLVAAALGIPSAAYGAATTIRESAFGLPHIFADTDLELARENGREIAKDRLGQMILLARVGRGTLYQAFGALDATTLNGDIETRRTGYTSSELNNMWAKLPHRERDMVMEYCKGVNDTIDAVYGGTSPEPIEVNLLRNFLGLADDLFGNKNNVSDGVDPNYAPAGGAWPNGGFQFTPEMAMSIAVLEVRNFGFESLEEDARFAELQSLIAARGAGPGTEIWDDLNFLNDPLAPVSVPDPNTPGFGGPLAAVAPQLLVAAARFPHYDYRTHAEQRRAAAEARKETAMRWGAWPALGSYAWVIGGNKTTTGYPWLGGFPQTGIQTPSIMHFAENRSAEGTSNRINGIGMEFAGAPLVLIGQTDSVAYTTTTALLRLVDVSPALQADDQFFAVLGHLVGKLAADDIPVIDGVTVRPPEDQLKAFAAAAASSGRVALFHIVGVTPEAPTAEAAFRQRHPERAADVTAADLRAARRELTTADGRELDMVILGSPHFSLAEFARLAPLVAGRHAHPRVKFLVTSSRFMKEEAERAGHLGPIVDFGAQITLDTCILASPMLPPEIRTLMTNSAKYAYYAPSLLNTRVTFGSLSDCVTSAVEGVVVRDDAAWADR